MKKVNAKVIAYNITFSECNLQLLKYDKKRFEQLKIKNWVKQYLKGFKLVKFYNPKKNGLMAKFESMNLETTEEFLKEEKIIEEYIKNNRKREE